MRGVGIKCDIENNNLEAQIRLGLLFYRQNAQLNIDKIIYYFTLAANQNDAQAQYYIGFIYLEGKYVRQDIDKAIYYLSISANKNFVESQFVLGAIYLNVEYN